MQSTSLSPRKKLIRKNSKTSPTKPKLAKAKSMSVNIGSFTSFSCQKTQQTKSIQEIQNQLQKLSHGDKLYQVQSITLGQLKKICNFVNDKQAVTQIHMLMEEEKVGEMSTQDVEHGANVVDLDQMLGGKMEFEMPVPLSTNNNDGWATGLMEMEEPVLEPWWSMKEDGMGDRLDLF